MEIYKVLYYSIDKFVTEDYKLLLCIIKGENYA